MGILLVLVWACAARAVRGFSHLREHPAHLLLTPVMVAVVLFIALPVRAWACLFDESSGLAHPDGRETRDGPGRDRDQQPSRKLRSACRLSCGAEMTTAEETEELARWGCSTSRAA